MPTNRIRVRRPRRPRGDGRSAACARCAGRACRRQPPTRPKQGAQPSRQAVIECEGRVRGQPARPPRGRCTITGAITDRGAFVDDDLLRHTSLTVGRSTVRRALSSSASTASGADTGRSSRERRRTPVFVGEVGEASTGPCTIPLGCTISLTMTGTVSQSTSTASPSPALRGEVRIHLRGSMSGPQFAAFGRGRFTASGAIADRGRFVDEFEGIHPRGEPRHRTLRGAKGTLLIEVDRVGHWRVTKGTKAYAGLRGRGTLHGRYQFTGIDATMIGTV